MFEKEAKKYQIEVIAKGDYPHSIATDWKRGAEFGYNKAKEELKDAHKESVETQNEFIIQLQKELEEEKKLNAEIKARFVKCNTCTDEMKSKCLMFTENLCEGERCEELIDIVSLVNKSDLERKIEALEKANEWHYVKDGDYPKEKGNYLVAWKRTHHVEEFGKWGFDVDLFNVDEGYFEGDGDYVIAWKEIVLPELPKESEQSYFTWEKQ